MRGSLGESQLGRRPHGCAFGCCYHGRRRAELCSNSCTLDLAATISERPPRGGLSFSSEKQEHKKRDRHAGVLAVSRSDKGHWVGDGDPLSSYLFKFEPKISGQDIVPWDNSAPCVQWRNVRDINNLAVAAMTFGDRVRTRRNALGMRANELAKRCSMSGSRIAGVELTAIQPRADIVRRLAKALNVSADYLLELDDKPRRLRAVKQKNDDDVSPQGGRRITARAPTPP